MARLALVASTSDLADRIEIWLKQEHVLTQVTPDALTGLPASDAWLVVLPRHSERTGIYATVIRREVDHTAMLVTGEEDRCPEWLDTLSLQHRSIVPVFPASPAALQVAARNLVRKPRPSYIPE